MPTPSAINKQTIIRIQVRLLGHVDEEWAEQEEGDPMETKAEAAGQTSTSRSRAKRSRASTSSYTSRCIPDHLGKDWWPQRGSKSAYWKDDSNAGSAWYTFNQDWQHLHQLGALTLWPFWSKRGRIFKGSTWGGVPVWGGEAFIIQQLFKFLLYVVLFMFWIIVDWVWYTVVMVNVWFKLITHGWF